MTTTVPTAGDEERLVARLRDGIVVQQAGPSTLIGTPDFAATVALMREAADRLERLSYGEKDAEYWKRKCSEAEDEAINWTETVERHGTDGFDDLAEAWLALPAIQRTTNAAISTFARWANDDLMARFKKNQLSMFHLAFVEGCLAGVRAEAALSASNAEAERLREALSPEVTEAEIDDAVRCIKLGLSAGVADAVNVGAALRRFAEARVRALQGSAKQ